MSDQPVVKTSQGSVRGVWRELGSGESGRPGMFARSAAFLGIPFAEPPVGARRFAAPVPHRPWPGVRDATAYGPTAQRRPLAEVTAIPEPSLPGDSTLNVNVFTPAPGDTAARLPVLVWIHGGGYKGGSPASPWYDGAAFNRAGVVTVTLSYRLGFDGFGWIADAPQNRGLLDQIEALRWVRRNVAAFGGDPGRVTIAGQSAGGGSVIALLSSPLAHGLFHAAISQSGALRPATTEAARAVGRRVAALAGVPCTRAGLAALTEDELLDLQEVVEREQDTATGTLDDAVRRLVDGGGFSLPFAPWLDGEVLVDPPVEAFRAGVGAGVPLLMGATAHEFDGAADQFAPLVAGIDLESSLASSMGACAQTYLAGTRDQPGGPAGQLAHLWTTMLFRVPMLRWASARGDAPTWLYDFRYRPGGDGLALHCSELPFTWDALGAERAAASVGEDPPQQLADAMHGAWVEFIRTHAAPWRAWDDGTSVAMVFADRSEARPAFALERALARALPA